MCVCFPSVKQRSRDGLLAARLELEDREKLREELQGVRVWLEAVGGVLSEMERSSNSTQELQVMTSHLTKLTEKEYSSHFSSYKLRLFILSLTTSTMFPVT